MASCERKMIVGGRGECVLKGVGIEIFSGKVKVIRCRRPD